jgi:undecaprenyl-diphosphatase
MSILHSIILGIVEGVTEFLPVSSTGHLMMASTLLGITPTAFTKSFEIAIQLGAILAVVVLYWRAFFDWELLKKLATAFVPTGIIGLAFYHVLKTYLLGNDWIVVTTLFLGGIVFILFERWYGTREDAAPEDAPITYRQALMIGVFQAVAIIPGVSRSGATIIGGMGLGIARATIVEFSFLLAVPTMLAATGLDLVKSGFAFSGNEWLALGIGFVVAFLVAMPVVRWFLGYVRKHSFTSFGIYRIIAAIAFALLVLR